MMGEIVARNMQSKATAQNKNAIDASCWTYFTTIWDQSCSMLAGGRTDRGGDRHDEASSRFSQFCEKRLKCELPFTILFKLSPDIRKICYVKIQRGRTNIPVNAQKKVTSSENNETLNVYKNRTVLQQ